MSSAGASGVRYVPKMSNDDASEQRLEEEKARERLRESEAQARETLEEAEDLEEPDIPANSEPDE